MTIYRPAGYGPPPTEGEREVASALRGMPWSAWLQRCGSSAPCVVFLWPSTEMRPDCTYCALGPDDLPCAIGEPPVAELEWQDGCVSVYRVTLCVGRRWLGGGEHHWSVYGDGALVARNVGCNGEHAARVEALACARKHAAEQVARWTETLTVLGGAP